MHRKDYYFGEGSFTARDDVVKEQTHSLIDGISQLEYIDAICSYVKKIPYATRLKPRTRTASQVILDNAVTGCTDQGIVFCAIAREAGIETAYVESLRTDWMEFMVPKELESPLEGFKKHFRDFLKHMKEQYAVGMITNDELIGMVHFHWQNYSTDKKLSPEQVRWALEPQLIEGHVFADVKHPGWKKISPASGEIKDYTIGRNNYTVVGRGLDFGEVYMLRNGRLSETPVDLSDTRRILPALSGVNSQNSLEDRF